MFRRKKKEEAVEPVPATEAVTEDSTAEIAPASEASMVAGATDETAAFAGTVPPAADNGGETKTAAKATASSRGNRVQKVGIVASDKMQKTVLVRVDRLVLHRKYRRYVRRTSKFMAHDELGSTTGDRVRIIETRPLSARKRWRVVEIVQKAAK